MQRATITLDPSPLNLAQAILAHRVQALCLREVPQSAWLDELGRAIEKGIFCLQRTELTGVDINAMANWLNRNLPSDAVSKQTRDELISDILRLAHLIEDLTAAGWYKLRILVATPNRRCSFHVDTVPPGAPTWGALRVYNGQGTDWIAPSQVRSMALFYRWLQMRDRVMRLQTPTTRDAQLEQIDKNLDFLIDGAQIQRVPAETAVIFKHLCAAEHWSDHPADRAWIHSSPMQGVPRLVVNISPHCQYMN